jgi:hypothetical protein
VTNEELEKYIREALRQLAYHDPAIRPPDISYILPAAGKQRIAGRWEGCARHTIGKGTLLAHPIEREQSIVIEHDTSAIIALHVTFERSGDAQFSGDGELDIDLSQLDIEDVNSVYVDIQGERLHDGRYVFEAQDIEDASCRMLVTATLSEDGQSLSGTYQAVGLLTKEAVTGEFYLKKARGLREDCEVITVEPMHKIVDLIRGASDSILVTHFATEIPPEDYIEAMLERLRDDIRITRIVAKHPCVPKEVYSWLNRFRRADATMLPYYREYQYLGIPLPFDIMVIDDEVAVQGFDNYPEASTYNLVICHNDTHIARHFRATIEALKSNQCQLTQHFYE